MDTLLWLLGVAFPILFLQLSHYTYGAPVVPEAPEIDDDKRLDMSYLKEEYRKYMEDVISVLTDDEGFKKKLDEQGAPDENRSEEEVAETVAKYLEYADERTRVKLDELKKQEIKRIKDLHKKLMKEVQERARQEKRAMSREDMPKVEYEHVNLANHEAFEAEDIKRLLNKANEDVKEMDKKRKQQFKQHEMNKEMEYREKLANADKEERKKLQAAKEESVKRRRDRKVNHPGNKKQLEEVWEEEDHMEKSKFDPRTFFMLHDVDGNGYLSIAEVEALFQKQLDEMYNETAHDYDPVVREEEMNRMREHVYEQVDLDKDGQISWDEFRKATQAPEFEKDEEWEPVDNQKAYTNEELDAYEQAMKERKQRMKDEYAARKKQGE